MGAFLSGHLFDAFKERPDGHKRLVTMTSPTVLSLKTMRERGYKAFVVERYITPIRKRIDFGNYADIIAFRKSDKGSCTAIQTTTTSNILSRIHKCLNNDNAKEWVLGGHKLLIQGWSKKGPRGKRKIYQLKEVVLAKSDFRV